MSTRSEKYWTESGRGDGQGDVEKKDHQSYRRPYMMGKARGKVNRVCDSAKLNKKTNRKPGIALTRHTDG